MSPRTSLLSAFTLSIIGLFFGIAASARDLPKEGTYSGTFFSYGTDKITMIGRDRGIAASDENGLSVGKGLIDHLTWHCFGLLRGHD